MTTAEHLQVPPNELQPPLDDVIAEQNRQGDGRPLLRLITEIMAPVRFRSPDAFESHRRAVNERLLLSGYQVREDGRLRSVQAADTLAEAQRRADDLHAELARRRVHAAVLHFCRAELVQQNYFHAVLEACKSVADKLRDLTGVEGDGAALVDATCSLSSGPRLRSTVSRANGSAPNRLAWRPS